ncbi:MAG: glycosyltransferase, partial [Flavobacteriales bacterium]
MGHATRCIPIIKELLTNNIDVVIAGSGKSLDLISAEFPLLQTLTLPDYDLHFNHFIPIGLHVVLQSLKIKRKIKREKLVLDNYLA